MIRSHTDWCIGSLVVGFHGEQVARPDVLGKGEADDVAPKIHC